MKNLKSKFIKTIFNYDRFNPTRVKVYEYRGHQYFIYFDICWNYIGIYQDVKGEHLYQQQKIDDELNNPKTICNDEQHPTYTGSGEEGFDLFYKYCEEE